MQHQKISEEEIEIKERKFHFFGVMYCLAITALLISSFALSNVFYFWIEDAYNLPTGKSLFMGEEYAVSVAWQIVMSAAFILCTIYIARVYRGMPEVFGQKWRQFFLKFMLFIAAVIFLAYLIGIVYGYFSGKSDFAALLKTFVMMGISAMGVVFFFCESRPKILLSTLYHGLVICTVLACMGISIAITERYASPSLMRGITHDKKILQEISQIREGMKTFYKKKGHLPEELKAIDTYREDHKTTNTQDITYIKNGEMTFSLSANFQTDPKSWRRVWYNNTMHKDVGMNVFKHDVKKEKNSNGAAYTDVQLDNIYAKK